jgi:hypothetical protein
MTSPYYGLRRPVVSATGLHFSLSGASTVVAGKDALSGLDARLDAELRHAAIVIDPEATGLNASHDLEASLVLIARLHVHSPGLDVLKPRTAGYVPIRVGSGSLSESGQDTPCRVIRRMSSKGSLILVDAVAPGRCFTETSQAAESPAKGRWNREVA